MRPTALLFLGAILAAAHDARAATPADVIVLESYAGERPDDAGRLMAPLVEALARASYAVGPSDLGKRIEETHSQSGALMTDSQLADVTRLVDDGYSSWLKNDFPTAIDKLSRAVSLFHASPATLAQDQTRRDTVVKALVGLALANKRQGRTDESTRAMAEVIRSFPDREFNRTIYGPEAHELYKAVKADLDEQGKGTLHVVVDDENVVVFVNERYESVGTLHKTDLLPGVYRVYVQKGTTPGRVHVATVSPGKEQTVEITWELDAALRTDDAWVGLSFPGAVKRQKQENGVAVSVGRSLGAQRVIVVSIATHDGRRSMVGTVLSVETAKPLRSAMLALEPSEPGEDQIAGLGEFLAGGEAIPGLIVGEGAFSPGSPRRRPFRTWKWVAAGLGTVAIVTGIVGLAIDGSCMGEGREDPPSDPTATGWSLCQSLWDTRTAGVALIAAGVAIDLAAVYLFVRDGRSATEETRHKDNSMMPDETVLIPSNGGVWVGVRWEF